MKMSRSFSPPYQPPTRMLLSRLTALCDEETCGRRRRGSKTKVQSLFFKSSTILRLNQGIYKLGLNIVRDSGFVFAGRGCSSSTPCKDFSSCSAPATNQDSKLNLKFCSAGQPCKRAAGKARKREEVYCVFFPSQNRKEKERSENESSLFSSRLLILVLRSIKNKSIHSPAQSEMFESPRRD